MRAQEPQRGQSQQREQVQREREGSQPDQRMQEPQRAQGQQREREREQVQRERPGGQPSEQRMQEPQRAQGQQREREREQVQRERQDERTGRRDSEQQRPDTRAPTPQTAQPPRPESRPGTPETARPGPSPTQQDERQSPGSTAQRPDATQPGAPGTDSRSPATRQSAEGERAGAEKQRIADTVRERVERNQIRPVENLGVSVSVGAELPSRVQLQRVPSEIASIRPQYRDYRYTVSEREIVIVDPRTRRIVEVIERDGGRAASYDVYAVFEQRRDVRRWRRPNSIVFEQGVILPAGVPYYDLPVELVERNPRWRGYQYVMTEDEEVAIVEPRSHRIVEVIDKNAARSSAAGPATTGSATRQATTTNHAGDRHEIVRIIMNDARPAENQGVDGLKGAVLPQEMRLRPVPAEASEQDQNLRGYHYTLIGDDVLIVDPKSRQVIDVIE